MAKRRSIFNISQLPDGIGGTDTFLQLLDTPNTFLGQAGKSIRVNITENKLEYYTPSEVGSNISFIDLTDTPSSYTGNGLRLLRVNALGSAIEFDPTVYVSQTRSINTNNGLTGGGNLSGDRTLGLTGQALALHNLATNGYVVRTGASTFASRTFIGGTGISLTNSDGVAGNTTITINATLENLNDVTLTAIANNQTIYYNGSGWVNGAYTTGTVTSIATGTGLTGGTITNTGTLSFDTTWGDARYARLIESLSTSSTWTHTSLQSGIDFTSYTTGSSGYPSTLGFSVAFYANTSDSTSGFGRAFALNREYNTESYYLGSPNTAGTHNGWKLIYHSGNLNIGTLGGVATSRTLTINGTAFDLSANRSWSVGTVTSITAGTGLSGGAITSSGTIDLTGQALALHNLSTNGIIVRTGAGTVTGRTIIGSGYINVTNGDGVSANPTISLGTFNLGDLSNITLTTPTSGQVLQYNGTIWVNASVAGGGGGTVTSITAGTGLSGGTITSSGTIAVIYGTTANTSAQGNDSRFHNPITIGTANGLSLLSQEISLALATTGAAGAMSASDKTKLDGLSSYSHPSQSAIDTGILGGADVISRVIVNTLGHVTTVSTRVLTAANIGAEPTFSKGDLISSTGISFSGTATGRLYGTGSLTITNDDRGSSQNIFKNIANSGGTLQFSAGNNNDTIRFNGTGATNVSFDVGTKTVTISSTDNNTIYTHPTFSAFTPTLSGANVISTLTTNTEGHVTALTSRILTLNDLGYTGNTNADNYSSWLVAASGTAGTASITSGSTLTLTAGSNVTVTRVSNNITISATDTNTTYSAGTGLSLSGTTFNNIDTGSSQNIFKNINNGAGAWQFGAGSNNDSLSFAGSGATTVNFDAGNKRITISSTDTNTTYSAGTGLSLSGTTFNLTDGGSSQNIFKNVYSNNDGDYIVANTNNTALVFEGSLGVLTSSSNAAKRISVFLDLGFTDSRYVRTSTSITINGVEQTLSANRSWTVTAATPTLQQVTSVGNSTSTNMIIGSGAGNGDTTLDIGAGRSSNGNSYIDLISNSGSPDYNLRLLKASGNDGIAELRNAGGEMRIVNQAGSLMRFAVGNIDRFYINNSGNIGLNTNSPDSFLAGVTGQVIYSSSVAGVSCATDSGYWLMYRRNSTNEIAWFNGSSDRMNLNNNGDLALQGTIKTVAPSGSSAQTWKLGAANFTGSGSPTHQILVEIAGTVYKLLAVT